MTWPAHAEEHESREVAAKSYDNPDRWQMTKGKRKTDGCRQVSSHVSSEAQCKGWMRSITYQQLCHLQK
jgi:hypothetical protein